MTDIHTGKLVESGLKTLRQLEAAGHFTAIATGRAVYKTLDVARQAGIHSYVANGGAALILNDQLLRNAPLDRDKALKIIREADELGYGILVACSDSIDVIMRDHRFLEQFGQRKEATNYIYRPDLDYDDLTSIYKIYISMPEKEEYKLKNRDLLGHIRMGDDYFWFQHDEKDQGIRDMMAILGGDVKDVVVFGDGENDMIMFDPEWTGIAMGNGYPDLLAKADYVTSAAEEDGIRKACLHFGWIEE